MCDKNEVCFDVNGKTRNIVGLTVDHETHEHKFKGQFFQPKI